MHDVFLQQAPGDVVGGGVVGVEARIVILIADPRNLLVPSAQRGLLALCTARATSLRASIIMIIAKPWSSQSAGW